ncbi:MAG: beta strand repeat-containing protein [Phycisphaerae bacterium]
MDFSAAATFAPGDLKIMKDEGAEVNTTNLPVDEGQGYSLLLTATEMQAARIAIYIVDQDATKVWLDRAIHIDTYGHASGQHAFDLDTASQIIASVTGSVGSVAGNVDGNVTGSIGSLAAAAKADVNAEVDAALDTAVPGTPTANSINERVKTIDDNYTAARAGNLDNLDAAMTSRLAPTVAGRTLDVTATGEAGIDLANTAGSLAKGTEITGFNDLSAAQVNTEVDTAIADANLNDLVQITGSVSDTTPAAGNFDGDAGLSATDNFYVGQVLIFTAGAMAGLGRRISGYTGATKNIVLENAFPAAPANGDAFSIVAIEVQSAAGGGATDWSAAEKENIRDALGVTGVKTAATGGQLQGVKTQTDGLNFIGTDVKATLDSEQVNLVADQSAATIGTVNALGAAAKADVNAEVDAALDTAVPGTPTANSINERVKTIDDNYTAARAGNLDNLDAAMTSRLAPTVAGRTLDVTATGEAGIDLANTAGSLAKGTEITGFNDLSAAQVNTEVDTAIADANLNDLVQITGSVSDTTPAAGNFDGDAGLSATDNFYVGQVLIFTAGAMAGLGRRISGYTGATKNIVLENAFPAAPANGDAFSIVAIEVQSAAGGGATDWSAAEKENIRDALGVTGVKTAATGGQLQGVKTQTDGLNFIGTDVKATLDSEQVNLVADQSAATIGTVNRSADTVHRGTAVGGGTSSISLDAGASVTDAIYNGCRIAILSGTGAGQSRLIITYNGTTKVASVQPVWTTQPSTDSVFTILAGGRIPGIEGTKNQLDDLADGDATLANQTNIEADTQDIQSRLPTALVAGRMKSDTEAISASVAAADQLELSVLTIATGSAIAGTLSTTQMTTDLTEATDDHYKGRTLIWTSGALNKQATDITAFSGANKMLTFTAVTDVPLAGDTFVIV